MIEMLKKNIINIFFVFLVLFIPYNSYGAVIVEQTDYAVATTTGASPLKWQQLGTGLSGTISSVEFILKRTAGSAHNVTWTLYHYSDSNYSLNQTVADNSTFQLSTTTPHVITLTSTYAFDPTKYYVWIMEGASSNTFDMYGSNFDRYSGGALCVPSPNINCGTSVFKDAYFRFSSAGSVNNSTRIVSLNSPVTGSVTPSTTVTLDFDYYFNSALDYGKYTYVGTDVIDTSTNGIVVTDTCDIVATGQSKCAKSVVLQSGKFYMWRAYVDGDTVPAKYSSWATFSVVSNPGGQTLLPTEIGTSTSSSTDAFSNVGAFLLNIPPISWLSNVGEWFGSFRDSSETATSTTLVLNYGGTMGLATSSMSINLQSVKDSHPIMDTLDNVLAGGTYVLFSFLMLAYLSRSFSV